MNDEWDFSGALNVIKSGINPEMWHAKNGSHPGFGWNIKTVIPKPIYASIDSRNIIASWNIVCAQYPDIIKITDESYDWAGNNLIEWQTVWIKEGFDIVNDTPTNNANPLYKTIMSTINSKTDMKNIIDTIRSQMLKSTDEQLKQELSELLEIAEVIESQTSEQVSKNNRKNLKVLDNDD
jgi:hypothetical protein